MPNIAAVRDVTEDEVKLVSCVEDTSEVLLGPYTEKEHNSHMAIIWNFLRINYVFVFSKIPYREREHNLYFEKKNSDKTGETSRRERQGKTQTLAHKATGSKKKAMIIQL